ncbi:amidohydrolase family protein [Patescibacteria group bacterium]|nr:amidohydrolase family protein [Patescibacteria group bacterium]MBU1683662.1 amidohydrolase family protein [Patescibacteria group bacterium]MBU1935715.1 amidohydrolase family protein [Patescibacteria group bacterium]
MFNQIRHPHLFGIGILILLGLFIFFLLAQEAQSEIKIIDTHEHIQTLEKAEMLREANANLGIEKTVLLPSPWETITLNGAQSFTRYRENVDEILKIAETYPDDFIPLCTISPLDDDALEYFQDCVERGGKGLKLYNGHSYYYEIFNQPLDSEAMMPIYEYAETNNIPVLFHVNIGKYMNELENVLIYHPDLVVSVPHFMVSSIQIERVEYLLNTYPNLYTDISFGSPQFLASGFRRLSNDTEKYTNFINNYADRVLFGADMVLTTIDYKNQEFMEEVLTCYKDILEKKSFVCQPVNDYYQQEADKFTESYENCEPKEGTFCISAEEKMNSYTKWANETRKLNGLDLSDEILQKIYQDNPLRFLNANQS